MKKYRFLVLALLLGVLLPSVVLAGATSMTTWVPGQTVKIVKVTWIADAAGEVWADIGDVIQGKVFLVKTDPAAVPDDPTDNYDVYLKDFASAYSYLTTTLENRDTANVEMIAPSNVPVYGTVGFSVSAAGNLNAGDVFFYIEVPK